jgi:RNA polymerase sigma factor (TIGR02999 family)
MEPDRGNLTELLLAWGEGDAGALEKLTPLVYDHLHRLARHYMAGERPGHTLQATALVNEAYMRLADCSRLQWQNRAQFFAVAAQAMRRILVDFARSRRNQKHGGDLHQTSFDEALVLPVQPSNDLIALDEALDLLGTVDPRKAKIVELRYFGGMEEREIAEMLRVSTDTVQREWKTARVWLYNRLRS